MATRKKPSNSLRKVKNSITGFIDNSQKSLRNIFGYVGIKKSQKYRKSKKNTRRRKYKK